MMAVSVGTAITIVTTRISPATKPVRFARTPKALQTAPLRYIQRPRVTQCTGNDNVQPKWEFGHESIIQSRFHQSRKKIQFSQKVDTPHLLEVRREKAMIDKHKQTKETRKKECLGVAMVLGFT